jgi:hypothetical protein
MNMTRWASRLHRVPPATGSLRFTAARLVRHRRGPVAFSSDIQVPSPRTMDPDVDADFARRFADAFEW